MTYKKGTISYDSRARIFWTLMGILICFSLVQIYAISATTKNVAERQALEKQALDITISTGSLEFTYIELRNQIDLALAHEKGYKESKNPTYISRVNTDSLGTFTLNR